MPGLVVRHNKLAHCNSSTQQFPKPHHKTRGCGSQKEKIKCSVLQRTWSFWSMRSSSVKSCAYTADNAAPHAGSTRILWSLAKLMQASKAVRSSTTLDMTGCSFERAKSFSHGANAPRLLAMLRVMYDVGKSLSWIMIGVLQWLYAPRNGLCLHNATGLQRLVETVGAHSFHRNERHVFPPGWLHAQDQPCNERKVRARQSETSQSRLYSFLPVASPPPPTHVTTADGLTCDVSISVNCSLRRCRILNSSYILFAVSLTWSPESLLRVLAMLCRPRMDAQNMSRPWVAWLWTLAPQH